jgi:hypothetical protein
MFYGIQSDVGVAAGLPVPAYSNQYDLNTTQSLPGYPSAPADRAQFELPFRRNSATALDIRTPDHCWNQENPGSGFTSKAK